MSTLHSSKAVNYKEENSSTTEKPVKINERYKAYLTKSSPYQARKPSLLSSKRKYNTKALYGLTKAIWLWLFTDFTIWYQYTETFMQR